MMRGGVVEELIAEKEETNCDDLSVRSTRKLVFGIIQKTKSENQSILKQIYVILQIVHYKKLPTERVTKIVRCISYGVYRVWFGVYHMVWIINNSSLRFLTFSFVPVH